MTGVIENKSRYHMFVIFLLELCYFYTGCEFFKHPYIFMKPWKIQILAAYIWVIFSFNNTSLFFIFQIIC